MIKNTAIFLVGLSIIFCVTLVRPQHSYAEVGTPESQGYVTTPVGGGQPTIGGGQPTIGGGQPTTGGGSGITLTNPLGNVTIEQFFLKIIDIVLVFAIPIIVIFIMLAGFKYVTANGNTEKIQQATTALTWAVIGGVLILGAKAILTVIQGTVSALQ